MENSRNSRSEQIALKFKLELRKKHPEAEIHEFDILEQDGQVRACVRFADNHYRSFDGRYIAKTGELVLR